MSQRLGDLLVKEKVITQEQLVEATRIQKETNCRLGSALVKLGFLNDEDVTNFLSRQYGVPALPDAGLALLRRVPDAATTDC